MDPHALSPHDARRLRVRFTVYRRARLPAFAVMVAVAFFVPDLTFGVWMAACGVCAVGLFALKFRGVVCPRCRHSVFAPRGTVIDGDEPEEPTLPPRCRACGLGLSD